MSATDRSDVQASEWSKQCTRYTRNVHRNQAEVTELCTDISPSSPPYHINVQEPSRRHSDRVMLVNLRPRKFLAGNQHGRGSSEIFLLCSLLSRQRIACDDCCLQLTITWLRLRACNELGCCPSVSTSLG